MVPQDLDLTHFLKVQMPVLIMKNKLTYALRSQPVGSASQGKEPHQFQTKDTSTNGFELLGPTQGCQNITGHGSVCVSLHLTGYWWTPIS